MPRLVLLAGRGLTPKKPQLDRSCAWSRLRSDLRKPCALLSASFSARGRRSQCALECGTNSD
jgi:hypothetical protein